LDTVRYPARVVCLPLATLVEAFLFPVVTKIPTRPPGRAG